VVSITLDDRDRAMLEPLRDGAADVESLARAADCKPEYARSRLPDLADNGLVRRADDAGTYAITDSGKRVVAGSPAGAMDDRIDTPPAVEERIESFDLRPDREEAVRNAFSFLRYWGEATASEIVDAVYPENLAGFESRDAWWTEFLRDRIDALPGVQSSDAVADPWRYAGDPDDEQDTDDGRDAPEDDLAPRTSVKYALERAPLSAAERSAVRAAFAFLAREDETTAAEVRSQVYPDHRAGYESATEWWADCIRDGFEQLPGVERADEGGDRWRYRPDGRGPTSTGPSSGDAGEPVGTERDGGVDATDGVAGEAGSQDEGGAG
jgi:predicted transcriptional regulator